MIGIYWGYVAMIEGLVARMKAEIGRPVNGDRHRRPRQPCSTSIPTCSTRLNPI